jgi:hypothetical protein
MARTLDAIDETSEYLIPITHGDSAGSLAISSSVFKMTGRPMESASASLLDAAIRLICADRIVKHRNEVTAPQRVRAVELVPDDFNTCVPVGPIARSG